MIKVNGNTIENIVGKTISEYLAQSNYDTKYVAVELNGDILPKALYTSTALKAGDIVEIVSFVGGG